MFNLIVTYSGRSDVFVSICLPKREEFYELTFVGLFEMISECSNHATKYGQIATFSNFLI